MYADFHQKRPSATAKNPYICGLTLKSQKKNPAMIQRTVISGLLCFLVLFTMSACDTGSDDGGGIPGPTVRAVADTDYITTATGLKYFDFVVGSGPVAEVGDTLFVDYTGWFDDGETIFDTSVHIPGRSPIRVIIGTTNVISGWTEGLQGMQKGGQRQLVLPPSLAYGSTGSRSIPPNSTLIFEVEVVEMLTGE